MEVLRSGDHRRELPWEADVHEMGMEELESFQKALEVLWRNVASRWEEIEIMMEVETKAAVAAAAAAAAAAAPVAYGGVGYVGSCNGLYLKPPSLAQSLFQRTKYIARKEGNNGVHKLP
ncbi:hypothetical protein AXF42_Ash021840 [Apostasia shenzhenica]|uniref:Uncharacterized protein n=1 Tax=Apostasia shenzhenica TaxID=1088818 RepID=A0A2I0B417_9ASPA|nr:hypothetical protein AXF42_Ash021840 [Apostasia shenzhenica]